MLGLGQKQGERNYIGDGIEVVLGRQGNQVRSENRLPAERLRGPQREIAQRRVAAYFYVECAVCGRPLRVLFDYLGQRVACGHCGSRFEAVGPASNV